MRQARRDDLRWGGAARVGLLVALFALTQGLLSTPSRAEELPITVPLSYIVNLSNWGPTTATGTAQVWQQEAEVRVTVAGLPVLSGQLYAVWLVNTQAGKFLPVGRFNVAPDGTATLDVSMQGSLPDGYNTVLITVQPDPETAHNVPSKLYSIAGFFPGNSAIQHQVKYLPDTGAKAEHPPAETATTAPPASHNHLLTVGLLVLSALGFAIAMRRRLFSPIFQRRQEVTRAVSRARRRV